MCGVEDWLVALWVDRHEKRSSRPWTFCLGSKTNPDCDKAKMTEARIKHPAGSFPNEVRHPIEVFATKNFSRI